MPVGSLAGVAPVRTYHASGNMAWAADSVRSGLPAGLDVRPVVLLSRTPGGGTDLAAMMGKEETVKRVKAALEKL